VQQVYLWYTVVFQIVSILQRIVTNKRSMLLILNNYVSRNLEVGLVVIIGQGQNGVTIDAPQRRLAAARTVESICL
jgi:hypothetical protein